MTALAQDLLRDTVAVVRHAFDGLEVFSCLSGSTAAGGATATSDIDLLVVLPDHLPLPEAVARREIFTRGYLALHRRHRRVPDRRWPGEVLYAHDLYTALAGAAFDLTDPTQRLAPCSADQPYRYWVSMIATGTAVTGSGAFSRTARRCASLFARHLLHEATWHQPSGSPSLEVMHSLLHHDWGVTPSLSIATVLGAEIDSLRNRLLQDGCGFLAQWKARLRPSDTAPLLDQYLDRWRIIAAEPAEAVSDHPENHPGSPKSRKDSVLTVSARIRHSR